MEIETPADMANTTLGANDLLSVHVTMDPIRCVSGKRGGREDSVCEESANKCEKTHVDTNAITRAGVTEDFDSLLRFYYGAVELIPGWQTPCDTGVDRQSLSIPQNVEMALLCEQ